MKKLLILSLVLGIASLASAGLQLSFNGAPAPDEVTVGPSDFFIIDVFDDVDFNNYTAYLNIYDAGPAGPYVPATLVSGATVENVQIDTMYAGADASVAPGPPAHILIKALDASAPFDGPLGGGVQFWMELHCEGEGDVIVELKSEGFAPLDSIIIHQTPEPATMGLLALGGLFLRRRK